MQSALRLLTIAILLFGGNVQAEALNPNIVLILADDMGYGDPRCYEATSKIPTARIDRLASEGMRFTDAHTPASVCSPTRYALLTGRYAWRTRLKKGVLGPYNSPLIEEGRLTLPGMLKEQGYTTACIGKWHLGMQWSTKDNAVLPKLWVKWDASQVNLAGPITAGPVTAGFDSYFGTDVPNFPPYCFVMDDHIAGPVPSVMKPENVYGNPGLMQRGWELVRVLPVMERKATEFIRNQADSEKPFFLYLSLTAPHTPIVPAPPYQGKSKAGDYGDFVNQVDHVVGEVMDALDRAGVADNTLLVFTSDNGSPGRAGDLHWRGKDWHEAGAVTRMFGHNPNAPWRGMKADAFEGGHRVPFIVRWPGQVAPNTTNNQLVCLVDLMATVAAVVDHPLPEHSAEDSFNLLDTWKQPSQKVREDLVHHSGNGMFAIREGRWKLIAGKGSGGWTKVQVSKKAPPGQLYDLEADPGETKNLWKKHPDVVERLQARLELYRTSPGSRGL